MKKFLKTISVVTAVSLLALTGCGKTTSGSTPKSEVAAVNDGGEPSGSNILIAYFAVAENSDVDASASASVISDGRGRMRALADMIQLETGGDLFSIKTSVGYPGDVGKLVDYAEKEQKDNARPELTSHIENLDDYDVIFIGYPTWWYDLPQVMYSFFDKYDFSGKTIVPFNSANGSRFSGTIDTIKELEPNANVIEDGISVHESDVEGAADEIKEWVDGLGYGK
ncbi:MAG: flavodoxin [Porcipelethomonas sp.]